MHAFSVDQEDFWPDSRAIAVNGELDLAVADQLRDPLERAELEEMHVLLDFSGCSFIDAAGLAVLVSAEEKLRNRGLRLLLFGVEGQVLRLLSLTGLTQNGLAILGSEDEAKRSLGREQVPA
jgi:stage II sporulation protein AA (anti-sigma F factor antagonist)